MFGFAELGIIPQRYRPGHVSLMALRTDSMSWRRTRTKRRMPSSPLWWCASSSQPSYFDGSLPSKMPRKRIANWRMIAKVGAVAFNQFTFASSWRVICARGLMQRMDAAIGGTIGRDGTMGVSSLLTFSCVPEGGFVSSGAR